MFPGDFLALEFDHLNYNITNNMFHFIILVEVFLMILSLNHAEFYAWVNAFHEKGA